VECLRSQPEFVIRSARRPLYAIQSRDHQWSKCANINERRRGGAICRSEGRCHFEPMNYINEPTNLLILKDFRFCDTKKPLR
jgi:hypothetical protein